FLEMKEKQDEDDFPITTCIAIVDAYDNMIYGTDLLVIPLILFTKYCLDIESWGQKIQQISYFDIILSNPFCGLYLLQILLMITFECYCYFKFQYEYYFKYEYYNAYL
ncbi:hypothetical protein ACJX0J_042022, partial [Zea mays]